MKKYLHPLFILLTFAACQNPQGRSWIIPVTIDPSDILYTPGQMESYEMRRAVVQDSMKGGCMVLKSLDQSSYSRHGFRANNYFYYLTGYDTPHSYLILGAGAEGEFILTMPVESIRRQIYDGGELSAAEIRDTYHPDRVLSYGDARILLDSILDSGLPVYTDLDNRVLMDELKERAGGDRDAGFESAAAILDEMRVFKEGMETDRLQKACNITALSLTRVMKECRPGMYEFQIESLIEGTFLEYGSALPGFPSIVGAGANSTTLHYEANNCLLQDGDLLLMDIGAEYGNYTADITRTIPVNGTFSAEQRAIYQLVLDAQKAAIAEMKPGKPYLDGHRAARKVISEGLTELGLMTDTESRWQTDFYCIHGVSHYLGLDVHDVGDYGVDYRKMMSDKGSVPLASRLLEPGMVLTIEPGIYIRENGLETAYDFLRGRADSTEIATFIEAVRPVYGKYLNTGVRIEDDILITGEGNLNLSRYAPKEIADIEQLMR